MATRVFVQAFQDTGYVSALTDEAAGRFDFSGPKTAARQATVAAASLRSGAELASIDCPKPLIIPIASVDRVELDRKDARVCAGQDAGRQRITFECPSKDEAAEVANLLVDRLGLSETRRTEPVGLLRAVGFPILFAAIAGWLWGVLFYVAGRIEAKDLEGINLDPKGMGKILLLIYDVVGYRGVVVLGLILLAGFLGWITARLVRRPLRTVWGSATA